MRFLHWMGIITLALAAVTVTSFAAAVADTRATLDAQGTAEVYIDKDGERPWIALRGVSIDPQRDAHEYFQVVVAPEEADADSEPNPPMLGEFEVVEAEIRFLPKYPLHPRVVYEVRLSPWLRRQLSLAQQSVQLKLDEPPTAPRGEVVAVYPSADLLPENLLKFYIHFSVPMSRGNAYQWIELYRGDERVSEAFLELGEELWDRQQQRFTLFVHPGRLKRGVRPYEELGAPLQHGQEYTLKIRQEWKDATGNPLRSDFVKRFRVGPPDREQLNPEHWRIETPKRNTTDVVAIVFDEPLDHAMLQRVLEVKDAEGRSIEGHIAIEDHQRRWEFRPDASWKPGNYRIEIAANLEDLCGNSLARPFEVRLQDNHAVDPRARIAIEFLVE
ncbi:MAG: hypothetical protein KatS3mg111_2846 [Pirellulaceae bacterium]|nr:MAG: hypothetical protein KatS3mg111_2846 [Pirellulaceae bacterium]